MLQKICSKENKAAEITEKEALPKCFQKVSKKRVLKAIAYSIHKETKGETLMNKTFKVIFNRARGALMVANEITSSVQKKGTKTAVATAVASALFCAMSGVASASDSDDYYYKVWNGVASEAPTNIELTSFADIYSSVTLSDDSNVEILDVATGATGELKNLSIKAKATVSGETATGFDVVGLGIQNEAAADATTFPAFSGDSLTITLESENTGDTSAIHYHGYHGDGNKVNQANITAKQLNLSVTATKDNSGGVGGIETSEGASKITSNNVNIVLKTPTTNTTANAMGIVCDPGIDATPETKAGSSLTIDIDSAKAVGIGVYLEKDESVANSTFGYENTTIKLNQNTSRKANGNAIALAVACDGGTWEGNGAAAINFAGNLDIDANTETGTAYGIALASPEQLGMSDSQTTGEAVTESRTVTVEGNTDITLTSTSAKAYGVYMNGISAGKVELKGDANINTTAKTGAFGVYVLNGGTVVANNLTENVASSGTGNAMGVRLKVGTASINGFTATVSSESGSAYGAYLASDATSLTLTGDVSITATSTNNMARGIALTTANTTAAIGADDKTVTISVTGQGGSAAISANKGGVATVKGKTITLNSNFDGVRSQSSTVNLGTAETERITINVNNKTASEESSGIISQLSNSVIKVLAKEFDVTTSEDFGILAQNNTQDATAPSNAATLIINAEKTTITNTATDGSGIGAFSNGQLTVNSDLTVSASSAIDVRGNSTVNINTDGEHVTKLDGDVIFETPNTPEDAKGSGNLINAYVNLVLSGAESAWNGRSYQEYIVDGEEAKLVGLEGDASYHGNVTGFNLTVADGAKWTLSGDSFVNTLALKDGGKIDASKAEILNVGKWDSATSKAISGFTVTGKGNELILGTKTALNGAITMTENSELIAPLATAFTTTTEENSSVITGATARLTVSEESSKSAQLTIADVFTYTSDALTAMTDAYKAITLNLTNATLATAETAKLIDGVIQGKTTVTADVTDGTTTIGASSSDPDVAVTTGAQAIELGEAAEVTVKDESNVTLVGKTDGGDLIKNATKVEVGNLATLNLGSATAEAPTSGALPEVTLKRSAVLNVINTAVTTKSLTGGEGARINLGTAEAAGVLQTEKFSLNGATIFLDPAWQNGATISDASSLSAVAVSDLNGTIVAGQNSIVALNATKDAAVAGFNKVSEKNSIAWGENGVTAGLYLGKPINATDSHILVNGALTSMDGVEADSGVTIASKGILMLDQDGIGTDPAVSGATVTIATDATVAVINAKAGTTLTLSDADEPVIVTTALADETAPETLTVLTDNPFVAGTLTVASGTIALTETADASGISIISTMGIQSMIRHADAVLAETIADRTATRESGLWVSVRGERYEQDDVGSGFTADVGYGAFGADFAPTDGSRLGVAIQYGHGKVKGNSFSAKNKFKDYSATLYGSADLGDTGIKLLGEVAYTQSKNDMTNTYFTGLNQDLDAKMYSGGVTLQKSFEVGSVNITPSVGVRVSRIETDAMNVGLVSIEKQKQTIVQVPVAVRLSTKPVETASGWSIAPRFKVAYIPTFGDKDIEVLGAKSTVLDTSPVQGAFGITFKKGGFAADLAVQGGVGNRGTSAIGGKIGLSYAF